MSAPHPATPAARSTAIVSLPVDLLFIGGLSILHVALFSTSFSWLVTAPLGAVFGQPLESLMALFEGRRVNVYDAAVLANILVWVINHPHFSATNHRLYRSRDSMMQFPVTAIGVPALLVILLTAALLMPTTIGPWLVKLFLIWSPYHFSAQTMGIAQLYAKRADFIFSPSTRKALIFFVFGTYLGPTLAAEGYNALPSYYGITIPVFGLPADLFILYKTGIQLAGLACLVLLMRDAWKQDKRIPLMMLVAPTAQYMWFIAGAGLNGFQEFVPAYHSLQYLFIAWAINLKERTDEGNTPRTKMRAGLESARWFSLNVAGGVFLFFVLPLLAGKAFTTDPYAAAGITLAVVQIHHFFVDGVIWKLRNPRVSQPLMTTWPELTGRSQNAT